MAAKDWMMGAIGRGIVNCCFLIVGNEQPVQTTMVCDNYNFGDWIVVSSKSNDA